MPLHWAASADNDSKALRQAARCALRFLRDYGGPEKGQIPFDLLEALATLTQRQLEAGDSPDKIRFMPEELARAVTTSHVDASAWVRKHWKRLDRLLGQVRDGLIQAAAAEGVQSLPVLEKASSKGGPGNYAHYRLAATPVPPAPAKDSYPIPPGGLRYLAERRRPVRLAGLWHIGVPLTRWRRVVAMIPFVIIGGLGLLVVLGPFIVAPLTGHRPTGAGIVSAGVVAVMTAVLLYELVGPLFITRFQRVMGAPDWLIPMKETDPCLLEWVEEPGHADGPATPSIQLIRYTGVCPICQGRVVVGGGGLAFWGRLVGRCQRSPREHVFSFDHVTRGGYPLRYRLPAMN